MGEYVENKDFNNIDKYYNEIQETEFIICKLLNSKSIGNNIFNEYFFEINTGDQYAHHDLELIKITPDRQRIVKARIEFEYAEKQKYWDYSLPRTYWHGINLLTRKKYGENFDIFLKVSPTYNSVFAIDCRNDFIKKNFINSIATNNSNMDMKTNEEKYEILWDDIDKYLFKTRIINGKTKIVQNGNICLVENDNNWLLLYRFIYYRFLKNYLGK